MRIISLHSILVSVEVWSSWLLWNCAFFCTRRQHHVIKIVNWCLHGLTVCLSSILPYKPMMYLSFDIFQIWHVMRLKTYSRGTSVFLSAVSCMSSVSSWASCPCSNFFGLVISILCPLLPWHHCSSVDWQCISYSALTIQSALGSILTPFTDKTQNLSVCYTAQSPGNLG